MDIVLENIIVGKADTTANWTSDATVYSLGFMMISSDATYSGTNVKKWKIANGVDAWADIDFVPVAETLAQVLANGNKTNELKFESNNGYATSEIVNSQVYLRWFNANYNNQLGLTDGATYLSYYNIATNKLGLLSFNDANALLQHTTLIDLNAPSVKKNGYEIATQSYVDGMVAGLLDDRGSYDASGNTFPSTNGSGVAGAIMKGDIWYISVAGTLGGVAVTSGDSVRALVNSPGQTASNWSILETNIGYVPENVANKTDTVAGNTASSTKYLSVKGFYDYVIADTRIVKSSFDVSFDGQGGVITVNANAIKRAVANGGTVTGFSLKGDVSGSIEIDMKKNGVSMVGAGNKIDLISQSSDTGSPTSWTSTTFVADDEIEFVVSSATTITKLWLTIKYDKTS